MAAIVRIHISRSRGELLQTRIITVLLQGSLFLNMQCPIGRVLDDDASLNRSMSLPLIDRQTVEQPLQLPAGDYERLFAPMVRPAEPAALQPPVMKPEPIVVPVQNLEFVALPITENKPAIRK